MCITMLTLSSTALDWVVDIFRFLSGLVGPTNASGMRVLRYLVIGLLVV